VRVLLYRAVESMPFDLPRAPVDAVRARRGWGKIRSRHPRRRVPYRVNPASAYAWRQGDG